MYPILRFFFSFKYSWQELELGTEVIIHKTAPFNPQLIVGVGVGGSIFGAMIAGNSDDTPFLMIDRAVQWDNGVRTTKLLMSVSAIKSAVNERRALIVSAEAISGEATKMAAELVRRGGAKSIQTACFVRLQTSSFVPDHCVYISRDIVQMPWRILTSYRNPDDKIRS
jgi:probable phosphoglycerate mutase